MAEDPKQHLSPSQQRLHEIIFEADTFSGRVFDFALIFCILFSVAIVMLDSIKEVRDVYGNLFYWLDWLVTAVFTIEYGLRLYCVIKPVKYALSFYGIIDLLAILPGYLDIFIEGTRYLSVVRVFRVLRIFRILKLAHFIKEADTLRRALVASKGRITVFILGVMTAVIFIGSAMYVIEGEENGYTSIPISIYWAIVTLTTVGYGDISPKTPFGQAFSAFIMILGYGIIAIPTGIVTAEIVRGNNVKVSTQVCPFCSSEGHDFEAIFCKKCGNELN